MNQREEIEILSSKLHDIYMQEADKQGNTRNARKYEDLSENVKEYDRVLARYIISQIEQAEKRGYIRCIDDVLNKEKIVRFTDKELREIKNEIITVNTPQEKGEK